jgi:soluble lytic murein transglycosylase-like protein
VSFVPLQRLVVRLVFLAVTVCVAAPARGELVYFSNGRTLSVKNFRFEGESLVLSLRGGGEIVCEASIVARIEPDEIPYPEEAAPPAIAVAPGASEGDAPLLPSAQLQASPRFDSMITLASVRHGVDPALVKAVIQVESNYEPRARSRKGARGLMQLMPSTARRYGVSNLYDPESNVDAGIRHLKSLLDRFPLTLALAAYNAGEAAVQRFGGVPPFAETRTYVERIMKLVGRS